VDRDPTRPTTGPDPHTPEVLEGKMLQARFTMQGGQKLDELVARYSLSFSLCTSVWCFFLSLSLSRCRSPPPLRLSKPSLSQPTIINSDGAIAPHTPTPHITTRHHHTRHHTHHATLVQATLIFMFGKAGIAWMDHYGSSAELVWREGGSPLKGVYCISSVLSAMYCISLQCCQQCIASLQCCQQW
jgi:hypothetical protein